MLHSRCSSVELLATAEGLVHERLAVEGSHGDSVWLTLIDRHLVPLAEELARRTDRWNDGRGPNPQPGWISDLVGLASEIRRVADIRYPLDLHGWVPVRISTAGEAAGSCPWCGGHDRFVLWPASADRDGRVWCRRCGYSGDVIGLYRDLEGVSFVRALEDLAGRFGVAIPRVSQDDALVVLGNARHALQAAS